MVTRRSTLIGATAALASIAWNARLIAESDKQRNTLFLTSDDGPEAGTAKLLDIIERLQVPITLFMIGMNASANAEHRSLLVRARKSPWVTIGNHSESHCLSHYVRCYHDTKSVISDFRRASNVLGLVSRPIMARGPGRNVWRLPGMRIDDPVISYKEMGIEDNTDDVLFASGFYLYGWDVEWQHDARGIPVQTSSAMIERLAGPVPHSRRPGKVVMLMHDIMMRTAAAADELVRIIEGVRERGSKFARLSEY